MAGRTLVESRAPSVTATAAAWLHLSNSGSLRLHPCFCGWEVVWGALRQDSAYPSRARTSGQADRSSL
jgi:hypothetical protein